MCLGSLFGGGSPRPAPVVQTAPPPPPSPTRADEENRSAVESEIEQIRRRRGTTSTMITGGLGDAGYGNSVSKPSVTALGSG